MDKRIKHIRTISIPAFREEGDPGVPPSYSGVSISIPAFREEGDEIQIPLYCGQKRISIPAFREEGDTSSPRYTPRKTDFNPRLP